jgi:hypothetical protein
LKFSVAARASVGIRRAWGMLLAEADPKTSPCFRLRPSLLRRDAGRMQLRGKHVVKGGWRGGPWAAGLLAPSVGARLWGARAKVQYRSL